MLKYLLITVLILVVTSCGSSTNDTSSSTTEPTTSSPIDYTDKSIYPISETVIFSFHTTDDIFKLSDGSAWQITGASISGVSTGRTTSNVVINNSTTNTPDPVSGNRSDFYLIGDGIQPSFFITPLLMTPIMTDTVVFSFHTTDDIFKLSDGSAWQITGASISGVSTGSTTSNVAIYNSTTNTPDPISGNRSNFYLIGEGIHPAFFINPLLMTPIMTDTVVFSFHTINDVFTLSDGSAWQITGASISGVSTGSTTSNVVIYNSTTNTPDPVSGNRSNFYLIGEGIHPAFFITPI